MIKIERRNGLIGGLLKQFNIQAYTTSSFKESITILNTLKHKGLLALDTETTSLTFWKDGNYILGYSLAISKIEGMYFNSRVWTDEQHKKFISTLNSLQNDKTFWNWYFDYGYSKAHYDVGLDANIDGMLWFHTLFTNRSLETLPNTQKKKGYSLKELTSEYTEYGDYESDLKDTKHKIIFELNKQILTKEEFNLVTFEKFIKILNISYTTEKSNVMQLMNNYIKKGKTLKEKEFCYGFFPDTILDIYAIFDVLTTWELTNRCINYAKKMYNNGWEKVYDIIEIKHKATKIYADASIRGFKVDREYVKKLSNEWKPLRDLALHEVMNLPEIKKVESILFRNILKKEQKKKKPYNSKLFTKHKFSEYYRNELIKAQNKRKSKLPLSRCRKLYITSKLKFNNKKNKAKRGSKLSLNKCRNIYNSIEFNLNSSQHKKILFIDLMHLTPLEFNKKDVNGNQSPKLNGDFISHYADKGYYFMEKINSYLLYQKGISSFLGTDEKSEKGLWNLTTDEHPYNHSNFRISGTISSRLSTSNVNLSQMPSRGILHNIKNCFVVEDNYKLFTFDYATSELRVLASLADEPTFKEAFEKGLDLHSKMAYNIWKDEMDVDHTLPEKELLQQVKEKYGDTYRYYAKGINFGLPYSITEVGLSKSLGVSKKEAKSYIDKYNNSNKKIAQFIDNSKDKVKYKGYTEGSYGERLYLNNAKGYNWRESKTFKRGKKKNWKAIKEYKKATNFIIQSDNAFMLYYSLVSFMEDIEQQNLDITLIASIYDSIYIRVHKSIDDKVVYDLLKKHFEIDFYGIPMKIDVGIALNKDKTYSKRWGDLTDITYKDLDEIKKINEGG